MYIVAWTSRNGKRQHLPKPFSTAAAAQEHAHYLDERHAAIGVKHSVEPVDTSAAANETKE